MDRATEIALLEELAGLSDEGLFFLEDDIALSPMDRYGSPERFAQEQVGLFRALPIIAAHSSELADPDSFLTRDLMGQPLLLTRDGDGTAHAFLNVCRHRGARLVDTDKGCKRAFSCPYHAWTFSNRGDLRGVPHERPGFPGIDKKTMGLRRLPILERAGLIWVIPDPKSKLDMEPYLAPVLADLEWAGMPDLAMSHSMVIEKQTNWKLLVEGGIEAYHFKVTHKNTIGPHFPDNLSSYQMMGDHMRSVLPKNAIEGLSQTPREEWNIREIGNIIYSVFPTSQFLQMEDHIAWIEAAPLAHDRTRLRLSMLVPKDRLGEEDHWKRNFHITVATLSEDFDVNEAVQAGIATGANDHMTFGRYEGALEAFNKVVESHL